MKRPRIANHLASLRVCQFVTTRRQGLHISYRIADPTVATVLDLAHDSLSRTARRVFTCPRT